MRAGPFSLHNGFGYLVFRRRGDSSIDGAFVTLQHQSPKPAAHIVLKLARLSG